MTQLLQVPEIQTPLVIPVGQGHHDHIECSDVAYQNDYLCNIPPSRDFPRGTLLRCEVCGAYDLNIGYAWKRIGNLRARWRLLRGRTRGWLTASGETELKILTNNECATC